MALRYSDKEFTAFQLAVFTGELAVLYGCLCLASLFFSDDASFEFLRQPTSILIFGLTYYLAATLNGIVLHHRNVRFERILARILRLILVHSVLLFVCFSVSGSLHLVSLKFALCYLFLALCGATLWRQFLRIILQVFRKRNIRKVILLGTGTLAEEVYNRLIRNENNSYQLMGCFDDRPRENMVMDPDTFFLGKTDAVIPYLQEHKDIFEIFCALPSGEDRKALRIMNYAENHLIRFSLIPDFKRFLHQRVDMQFIDRIPIVFLRHEPLRQPINRFLKRLFDLIFSLIFLLTVFIPIFLIVSLAIKIESKGPIFFRQKRTGKDGHTFSCLKFRSMRPNEGADRQMATKGDARVTKVGAFLRKTNLDETPQFINVLLGDMSIVGPRPLMLKQTEDFSQIIDRYMLRHLDRPGITGLSQVSGYRGELTTQKDLEDRARLDVFYFENWSFLLDIKIILRTVFLTIVGDKKAY